MKDGSVVTCRKCGTKHYMKSDGTGGVMPVYCCGERLGKATKKPAPTAPPTSNKSRKK
ncbi:MAG: hypothetical protein HZB33_08675 [Nitrospirae bacterium]|nr:hypothetical protein [Nitrospirota bacterium]